MGSHCNKECDDEEDIYAFLEMQEDVRKKVDELPSTADSVVSLSDHEDEMLDENSPMVDEADEEPALDRVLEKIEL